MKLKLRRDSCATEPPFSACHIPKPVQHLRHIHPNRLDRIPALHHKQRRQRPGWAELSGGAVVGGDGIGESRRSILKKHQRYDALPLAAQAGFDM